MPGPSSLEDPSVVGTLPILIDHEQIWLLDQRRLPANIEYFAVNDLESMCFAIKEMVVRGAPSIGVAAAFGMAKDAKNECARSTSSDSLLHRIIFGQRQLDETRPTAVNLTWATRAMLSAAMEVMKKNPAITPAEIASFLWERAIAMLADHIDRNRRLGEFGAELVSPHASILTHCNAGSLATCGWGTALGVIRSAHLAGLNPHVYVDETRPRNQGSKITMWELQQDGIPTTLICDSLAPYLMSQNKIDFVVVGADRIARNGDTANKVGTYMLALSAFHHKIPFYVAAPSSTIDFLIKSGAEITLEERQAEEVTRCGETQLTVGNAAVLNLAFDITPSELISGIITEHGVLRPPFLDAIGSLNAMPPGALTPTLERTSK
jgi:methylthioribose-1-phosphate isomerase